MIDPGEVESLVREDRAIRAEILRHPARLTDREGEISLKNRGGVPHGDAQKGG